MRLTVYFPEDSPTTHEFVGSVLTIGRLGDNDVQLDDGSVSSRHAEIVVEDGGAVLRDLGSTNGTFLNAEQVAGEHSLSEGDEIYFGGVRSVFMEPVAVAAEPLPAVAELPESVPGGRPANFRYMSPIPRREAPRDTLALGAWAITGLAVLAGAYAVFTVLGS
ncbi:MAG: FHA domain-containing protein [Chthoniobacterales bacterium]